MVVVTISPQSSVLRQHIAGLAQSEPCTVHTHCTARPRCITLSKIQNNRQFKERLKDYYACALSCRSSLTIFIIAVLYNLRILTQLTPHLPAMSLPSTETFHPSLWPDRACILSNTNVPKLAPFLSALHARLREMATGGLGANGATRWVEPIGGEVESCSSRQHMEEKPPQVLVDCSSVLWLLGRDA